jgi:pimeloyl-ACP methyl ester carboxylesterase
VTQESSARSDATRIETLDLGDGSTVVVEIRGSGPAVVMIHGWSCRRSDWQPVAADLSRDFTVITVDLPGHGDASSTRIWSISDLGALVAEALTQLGYAGVALVGHSMGAAVALEAASRLGDRARCVIAVDSLTYLGIYPRQDDAAFMSGVEAMAKDFEGSMVGLVNDLAGPDTPKELNDAIAGEMAMAEPEFALPLLIDLYRWDMDALLETVVCPVAVIAAEAFLTVEARTRFESVADLRVVNFGGHFYLREEPRATAAEIRDVLSGMVWS